MVERSYEPQGRQLSTWWRLGPRVTVPWQPLPCLKCEPMKDRIKPWADASRVFWAFFPWGRDALPSQPVGPPSHVLGLLPPHPQGCKDAYHPSHSQPPFSSFPVPTEKRSACIWPKSQGLVTHLTLSSANGLCCPRSLWQP